jgi:hypothetical protein
MADPFLRQGKLKFGRYTCADKSALLLRLRTDQFARAHTYAERYCESGEKQQETPRTIQETDLPLPVNESERLTRLFGAGAPFRPLFRPIPSINVLGPKNFLPTSLPQRSGRPYYWGKYP